MSKLVNFSKVAIGIAALSLSTSLWANSNMIFDPLGVGYAMSGPVYIVTDKVTGAMYEMDGIKCGKVISDNGHMVMDEDAVMGDQITDMRTNKSGIITGIKDQGTMEVTHDNGKTVRYQYVTFKIKPVK